MSLFRQYDAYAKKLHLIYLQTTRDRSTSVENEIRKITGGDSDLYEQLFNRYLDRYGFENTSASNQAGYVYLMKAVGFYDIFGLGTLIGRYKIGLTNSPERRTKELNGQQAPCPIECIRYIPVSNMRSCEGKLHKQFDAKRRHNEWFNFWVWELPMVHFAYEKYKHNFKENKQAQLPSKQAIATFLMLGFAMFAGSAVFAAAIFPTTSNTTEVITNESNSRQN